MGLDRFQRRRYVTMRLDGNVWSFHRAGAGGIPTTLAPCIDGKTENVSDLRSFQNPRPAYEAKFGDPAQSGAEIVGPHRSRRRGFRDGFVPGIFDLASRHDCRRAEFSQSSAPGWILR